jgi:uncharacterized protein YuzE
MAYLSITEKNSWRETGAGDLTILIALCFAIVTNNGNVIGITFVERYGGTFSLFHHQSRVGVFTFPLRIFCVVFPE